jgi:DHA1 family bicyclomycin/chloramphenicol resistance-like MFS transporter
LLDPSTQDAARGEVRRMPWRLVALLIGMSGVGSLSLNVLVPAIPGLVAKFAADPASVQLTISLYLLGLAFAQLVFGPLSDRFGRRPVVLVGLALATAASTAAIFAAGIASLIVARVAQSLGASTGQTIGRAIIRDLYERDRAASMIGLVTSVTVFMPMAAPLIGGVLDTLFGWESIFVFSAALSASVFGWAALSLPETGRSGSPASERGRLLADLSALVTRPQFFGYALCAGLGSAPFFCFLGGAGHVVVGMLGRTSAEYGLWFFLPAIGFMSGNFAVSRLTARFGIEALIWWGIGFTIVGCLLNAAVYAGLPGWEMVTLFLPQVIIGIGNGLLLPTAVAGAVSIRPQVAGTASGATGFIQMGIGAAAAQLGGSVAAQATGAMSLIWLMLAFGIATGLAMFTLVTMQDGRLVRSKWRKHSSARLFERERKRELGRCFVTVSSRRGNEMLTTILIIVLILALIGALPTWGYSRGWGYGPGGGLGLILIIVIVLALTGHI